MTDFFADFASDDLDALEAANTAEITGQNPAEFRPTFTEVCTKCGGSGTFYSYTGRPVGTCRACKGKGKIERRTSPEQRARAKTTAAVRKANDSAANWAAFAEQYADVAAWMDASTSFEFAVSLKQAVLKYGELTDRQMTSAQSCVAKSAVRKVAAVDRINNAPAVNAGALEAYFEKVGPRAKLRFEKFAISKAPVTGRNAGALYVKASDTYLGKIQGGKFFASRDAGPDVATEIDAVITDPLAAAVAYGRRSGSCCVCGRELTDPVSVEAGIGPICAAGF